MTEVLGIVGSGFGDLWATLHWCLRKAEAERRRLLVSTWAGTGPFLPQRRRLEEMLALIDAPSLIDLTDEAATKQIGYDCWGVRYYPTKLTWSNERAIPGVLAYQFDGRSSPEAKNPPREDVLRFHGWAESGGMSTLRLGEPHSMLNCVRMLQLAEAFIGVCSGMSLLAVSVGTPVYVVAYRFGVSYWYGPNAHTVCADLEGFMRGRDLRALATEDLYPLWRLSDGPLVDVKPEGSAVFTLGGHTVPGIWRKDPNEIFWGNGFRYLFSDVVDGRANVTQFSPHGDVKKCLAVKEKRV